MKKCSIVYVGLKSGIKWLDGDFNTSDKLCQSNELKTLQDTFTQSNDLFDLSQQQIGNAIETFLRDAGYHVVFNDYLARVSESMSENEAKKFIKSLKSQKEVKFKYKKVKDGSIREARGTLDPETIRKGLTMSDIDKARKRRNIPDSIIIYWDLDKKMFRSFRKANFISYQH